MSKNNTTTYQDKFDALQPELQQKIYSIAIISYLVSSWISLICFILFILSVFMFAINIPYAIYATTIMSVVQIAIRIGRKYISSKIIQHSIDAATELFKK